MRRWQGIHDRPPDFEFNSQAELAKGLVFAGLGKFPNSTLYYNSMATLNSLPNHGTLTNMAVPATATSGWRWDNFLRRWVLGSGATGGYVLLSGDIWRTTTTYSAAGWVKRAPNGVPFFSTENGPDGQWRTNLSFTDATPSYAAFTKLVSYSAATATSTIAVPLNVWTPIAGTCDTAGNLTVYVNGVACGTAVKAGTFSPTKLYFMANHTPAGAVNVLGSDFLCWNRALSAAEIRQLADPSNVMLSGLILPQRRRLFAATAAPAAYTLTCATGDYRITPTAAGLVVSRKLSAATGDYRITPTAASLLASRKIAAATGDYRITPTAAGLLAARKIAAATGDYRITPTAANLLLSRVIKAATGDYRITPTNAGLLASRKLSAATGDYRITPTAASLLASRKIAAATGDYRITPTPASLLAARKIAAATGDYRITPTNASLLAAWKLAAATGDYRISPTDATLTYTPVAGGAYGAIAYVHRRRRR